MSDWSHGYNVSQGYTYGFYRELSPEWLDLAAMFNGFVPPAREGDRFRYLELGCGQGFGLCLIASAYPDAEFVGIDFNPEHVAHGAQLARSAGLDNVRFVEADFARLAESWPADIGRFDYVTLHGIVAWVPTAIRLALARCLEAATRPGALAYLSYNSMPGWLSGMPLQHVLQQLNRGGGRTTQQVMADGVALIAGIVANGGQIGAAQPHLAGRLETIAGQAHPYLVQEYLHEEWHPLWFSTIAGELAGAKLGHVGSATLPDVLMLQLLPKPLREQVAAVEDPVLRQDVLAMAVNQSFRRDLFCRGARRQPPGHDPMGVKTLRLLMPLPAADLPIAVGFGTIPLPAKILAMIATALASGTARVADIMRLAQEGDHQARDVAVAIALLVHAGHLAVERAPGADTGAAARLNRVIAASAARGGPYAHIILPRLGFATSLRDTDMILLDAYLRAPDSDAARLADAMVEGLARLNRKLNVPADRPDIADDRAFAETIAAAFLASTVPLWKTLGALD